MKHSIGIFLILLGFFAGLGKNTFAESATREIIVIVDNIRNNVGEIRISLHNSEKTFLKDKGFRQENTKIVDKKAQFLFNKVPTGVYAVTLFHDKNLNSKMDTGWFGHPKEGYGVSNDARGSFGPPEWEDAKFIIDTASKTITLKLEYPN